MGFLQGAFVYGLFAKRTFVPQRRRSCTRPPKKKPPKGPPPLRRGEHFSGQLEPLGKGRPVERECRERGKVALREQHGFRGALGLHEDFHVVAGRVDECVGRHFVSPWLLLTREL
jgi:hypothetical protein